MRVDYTGMLLQASNALTVGEIEPALAEMLRQLQEHMTEFGLRRYAGDTAVVDELLQLYCVAESSRKALHATAAKHAAQHLDDAPMVNTKYRD